jgi:CheY-like chemotaxis protein
MDEVHIVLVEDDEVDVMAVKRALRDLKIPHPLHCAIDGIEALQLLRGENGHAMVPSPHLILLDLNMPRMGGLEFLDALRKDHHLRRSIVFVMTTSAADEDRDRAYEKCVSGYILKHSADHSFMEAVYMLSKFSNIVEFPGR